MAPHKFSFSGPKRRAPAWLREYEAAVQETERSRLFKKIEVAEAAVLTRREVLEQSADGFAERQQLKMALAKLHSLKKEVLKFP
jgi:hypothetical protein